MSFYKYCTGKSIEITVPLRSHFERYTYLSSRVADKILNVDCHPALEASWKRHLFTARYARPIGRKRDGIC